MHPAFATNMLSHGQLTKHGEASLELLLEQGKAELKVRNRGGDFLSSDMEALHPAAGIVFSF